MKVTNNINTYQLLNKIKCFNIKNVNNSNRIDRITFCKNLSTMPIIVCSIFAIIHTIHFLCQNIYRANNLNLFNYSTMINLNIVTTTIILQVCYIVGILLCCILYDNIYVNNILYFLKNCIICSINIFHKRQNLILKKYYLLLNINKNINDCKQQNIEPNLVMNINHNANEASDNDEQNIPEEYKEELEKEIEDIVVNSGDNQDNSIEDDKKYNDINSDDEEEEKKDEEEKKEETDKEETDKEDEKDDDKEEEKEINNSDSDLSIEYENTKEDNLYL